MADFECCLVFKHLLVGMLLSFIELSGFSCSLGFCYLERNVAAFPPLDLVLILTCIILCSLTVSFGCLYFRYARCARRGSGLILLVMLPRNMEVY